MTKLFSELGLSEGLLKAVSNMGFEESTPIQTEAIPIALTGKDLIGQAHTGTGKTAAFGIPMIEKTAAETGPVQGLVIAPTRELAVQVAEELNKIGHFKGVRTIPVYGGQDISRQIRALQKRPHLVAGTPGRLLDHLRRRTLRLQDVKTVVLDEADEMLNMGFIDDIKSILAQVPQERHTMLFSATMPPAIQALARQFMQDPSIIKVKAREVTVPKIEQSYIEVHEKQKFDALCRLLDIQAPEQALVFGRTKRRVDEIYEGLSKRGYSAEGIHGDLTQSRRDSVLRHFREGVTDILVATDVAARGLDIDGITHVYNFDIPQDPESYVHRVGRTGRAGRAGVAITFVTYREMHHMRTIERVAGRRLDRRPIPSIKDAIEGQQRMAMDQMLKVIESENLERYKEPAEEMLQQSDSITLLAAALKLLTKEPDSTPVKLTEEKPQRKSYGGRQGSSSYYNRRKNTNRPGRGHGKGKY